MSTGSHFESEFIHNPIVYAVACLLYGVATSDSVYTELQVGFNMRQLISVDSGHFTQPECWSHSTDLHKIFCTSLIDCVCNFC